MNLNLDILRTAQGLASHSADRQVVIAENIAHADTPGYHARDLTKFSESYGANVLDSWSQKATRPGHIHSAPNPHGAEVVTRTAFGVESPNGNTVSIEDQMMRSAEIKQNHDLAIGVYRKTLDILRMSLGTR